MALSFFNNRFLSFDEYEEKFVKSVLFTHFEHIPDPKTVGFENPGDTHSLYRVKGDNIPDDDQLVDIYFVRERTENLFSDGLPKKFVFGLPRVSHCVPQKGFMTSLDSIG